MSWSTSESEVIRLEICDDVRTVLTAARRSGREERTASFPTSRGLASGRDLGPDRRLRGLEPRGSEVDRSARSRGHLGA